MTRLEVEITLDGDGIGPEDMAALRRQLDEHYLPSTKIRERPRAPGPGELGGALILAAELAGGAGLLVSCLRLYLSTRQGKRIVISDADSDRAVQIPPDPDSEADAVTEIESWRD